MTALAKEHELVEALKRIRYDLTACQAKLSDALKMCADLNLAPPEVSECPMCGARTRGPLSLAEHMYLSHDGPEPQHWIEAERIAEPDPVGEEVAA